MVMPNQNCYRKRIGKDLRISFDVRTNGELLPLEGRSLVLELVHEYGKRSRVPFTVSGHKVTLTFHGREQQMVGRYRLTLWENLGCDGQSVVDTCDGFELVPCSCQESNSGEDGLEVESIDLGIANLEVGSSSIMFPLLDVSSEFGYTGDFAGALELAVSGVRTSAVFISFLNGNNRELWRFNGGEFSDISRWSSFGGDEITEMTHEEIKALMDNIFGKES